MKIDKLLFSSTIHKSTQPLELIHSDLWGPAPLTSHFGFNYYVIFIDGFSRFSWLYNLKKKSELFENFLEFKRRVENQSSSKIKSFQSDWGGEYQPLHSFFKQEGITHRVSSPHTPKQNGTAERKHRHIVETALSLLKQASLPQKYWDEATSIAIYLINRLPTPILQNLSPYEKLYNKIPNYAFLKTFGCLCYLNLRCYSSNKLTSRLDQCVFLGYSGLHHGYQCLSLQTAKLFISRYVIFNESVFPYKNYLLNTSSDSTSKGILGINPHSSLPLPIFHSTSPHISHHSEPPIHSPNEQHSSSTNISNDHCSPKIVHPDPLPLLHT